MARLFLWRNALKWLLAYPFCKYFFDTDIMGIIIGIFLGVLILVTLPCLILVFGSLHSQTVEARSISAKMKFCSRIAFINKRMGNIPVMHDVLYLGVIQMLGVNLITPANRDLYNKITKKYKLDEVEYFDYLEVARFYDRFSDELLVVPKTWNQVFEEAMTPRLENKNR